MSVDKCIFCKIVNGELSAPRIYEDDKCIVIPDKYPVMKGQCLVIPKTHVDYAFDLDDETYSHCLLIAKKIGNAIDKALDTDRTCLLIEGFEVSHVHVKLFPTFEKDLIIHGAGKDASVEELNELVEEIKSNL